VSYELLSWFVIGLVWAWTLIALGALILVILEYLRDPPRWWVRQHIPDYYDPNDWKGSDAEDISSR
jgi:hypothetical protein